MTETVRSYSCGCDFGEDFTHLCVQASEVEADEHYAMSDVMMSLTSASHLVDDANRDDNAEVIDVGSSYDMRDAAKHLRVIAAELEKQANHYEKALADASRYRRDLNNHFAVHTYRDVQIAQPPEVDV